MATLGGEKAKKGGVGGAPGPVPGTMSLDVVLPLPVVPLKEALEGGGLESDWWE